MTMMKCMKCHSVMVTGLISPRSCPQCGAAGHNLAAVLENNKTTVDPMMNSMPESVAIPLNDIPALESDSGEGRLRRKDSDEGRS